MYKVTTAKVPNMDASQASDRRADLGLSELKTRIMRRGMTGLTAIQMRKKPTCGMIGNAPTAAIFGISVRGAVTDPK